MYNLKRSHLLIIAFFIMSCFMALFGMGLSEHILSDYREDNSGSIFCQSFTTSDNITTIHVSESNLTLAIIKGIRNSSNQKTNFRNNVLIIFVLTILSGVFRLTSEIFSFYHRLYVWHHYMLIAYIHAKDGCKLLSSC